MNEHPLRAGLNHVLDAVGRQEQDLGDDAALTSLLAETAAGRRHAAGLLRQSAAGTRAGECGEPEPLAAADRAQAEALAADAAEQLRAAQDALTEAQLAADPHTCDHPQYVWRDAFIYGMRQPISRYAEHFLKAGAAERGVGLMRAFYTCVLSSGLPDKAISDVAYDLACVLALAGSQDEAMDLLPVAFERNDAAAVPVLRAWAREDADLAALRGREDFRTLLDA
jgi:hypothetical protein